MTNPDREELVKLADDLSFIPSKEDGLVDLGCVTDVERDLIVTALRRLASSDSGVKGEPEPVAWIDFADNSNVRLWTSEKHRADAEVAAGRKMTPVYAAPPADAGMRETFVRVLASLAAAISILERTPKAKKAVASDKMFDTMLDDYRKALEAGRAALTAPGVTTKSDGGAKAGSSPTLADKGEQRTRAHGMMPVGDNAANVGFTGVGPSDHSSTRSDRWVCAARQRGVTLDQQDCDWPVCGCDPLANKVLDTIAESGFVIVPKDDAPMTDDQIKHMVDRFLMWQLPENFNPDAGISYTRPNWPESWPGPVGTNLFDAVQVTAMVRHMLYGLPSSTRSEVTVEIKHLISSARAFLAHFNPCDLAEDKSQQWQSLEHQCNRVERALLNQFEIRRK